MESRHPGPASLARNLLEFDPGVIYFIDTDYRITWCNAAWDEFAARNGGRGLERHTQTGRCILDATPDELHPFFTSAYQGVLNSLNPADHHYECSSDTDFRLIRMSIYPNPHEPGLVIVNTPVIDRPHTHTRLALPPDAASASSGIIVMCMHCRRTRHATRSHLWLWIPDYVQNPPARVSHALCNACAAMNYPALVPRLASGMV